MTNPVPSDWLSPREVLSFPLGPGLNVLDRDIGREGGSAKHHSSRAIGR